MTISTTSITSLIAHLFQIRIPTSISYGAPAQSSRSRMADIVIDDQAHGPAGNRRYSFDPTFLLRGLSELHLTFSPVSE